MQRTILPAINLSYSQANLKNKDIFPHVTGGRNLIFQGNLSRDIREFDQTQMYPFMKK